MSTVCQLRADMRYYLCMEPVDMRMQFQGLQGIINKEFGQLRLLRKCKNNCRKICPIR